MSGGEFQPDFRLGKWLVSAETCTLSAGEHSAKVTPRSMEVLLYLAANPDHVISSQELLDQLWTNITSDHAVHKAIAELRGAVQDDASRQSFIKTVPKRGYKLADSALPVRRVDSEQASSPSAEARDATLLSTRRWPVAVFLLLLLSVGVALLWPDRSGQTVAQAPRIGVLPFQSDTVDGARDQFLADGLTNSLLTGLSKLNGLDILSLPHDSRLSTSSRSLTELGEELGIEQILEGSLLHVDDRIRVTVRLTRVTDGLQIYSQQFDLSQQDLFSVQDSIVSSVVDSLSIHLDENERRNMLDWGTTNAMAYRHFMQGEFYNNQFNPEDFKLAIEHHQSAIELDPGFENAYLGVATAANNLAVYSRMTRIEELRELVASVHREVATLDRSSAVLAPIQAIEARMSGINHLEQEELLREGILSGTAPDFAHAHYALFLIGARLFREAEQYLALAAEVDPYEISPDEIWSYRADLATPAQELMIRKQQLQERPNHIGILGTVARNLVLEGRLDEARAYIARLKALDTEGISYHLTHVVVSALIGNLQPGSAAVAEEYARGPDFHFSNGVLAFMLGETEKGASFWRSLQPLQKRRLRNLVYAVEKFFPATVLESDQYQALLEELEVGKSWQHLLMRGVLAMEPATGIPLSEQATAALEADRFMARNNLWSEQIFRNLRR